MKQAMFAALALVLACLFMALGVWQLERLEWKRGLIAQTENKLSRNAVAAPVPDAWPSIGPADAYSRVEVQGVYLEGKDTLVVASTRYGRGYWVLTPLQTAQGFTVLVNRGFIAPRQQAALITPSGTVAVQGLLRLNEPDGSVLQANQPAQNRWFSRDIETIARHNNLHQVAPYFIDAVEGSKTLPVGGLTVVAFTNNHLQYALTWFALALLALGGLLRICVGDRPRTEA